ncbi:MAG: cytochrome c oxidase subunit II [Bdellovibrionales bacterium]|nr:cytochrome c oxidase subunit II [Bdellovibrionales bacterium]
MLYLLIPSASAAKWLPAPATKLAEEVDQLIYFLVEISILSSLLVIGGFVYFSIRFRRKSEKDKPPAITHNHLLEFLWSFIPFLIFMFVFGWGWLLYDKMRDHPKEALEIHVYGQMWNWDFVYKNGKKSSGTLTVPVDKPVKLIMSSRDVIHSFFIPSFRIKQDVLPGSYTALSFTANKKGKFPVFCTELCGAGHSSMLATVHVMEREEWEKWLAKNPYKGMSLAQIGGSVFQKSCTACHTASTEKRIGPGLAGLFGTKREFEKEETKVADENYIRESILNPSARIVKGYGNLMTPFAGLLTEEEMTGLVEYIKSLKVSP